MKKKFTLGRETSLLGFIVLLSVLIGIRNHNFLTIKNMLDVCNDASIMLICAIGMLMVIVTGGIDLSIGATLGLSGMVCALVVKNCPGLPIYVIVLAGLATGLCVGSINGLLIAKCHVIPIMATLGTMYICRALIYFVSGGKWVNTYELTPEFINFSGTKIFGVSVLIIIAILVFFAFGYFLKYKRVGREIYAVGSNVRAASISGIKVERILFLVYALEGTLGGLGGMLWTSRYSFASFETGKGYEMSVIAACVLGGVAVTGGTGRITGVLLGTLLIGIINAALPMIQVSSFAKETIEGGIILIAVIVNVLMVRISRSKALQELNI